MSLINQALRKAQRDRAPNQMQEPGSSTPAQIAASSSNGMKPGLVIGLVVTVAVLIGLVAGLSLVLFRDNSSAPTVAAQEPAPVTPQATEPQKATPTPATTEQATKLAEPITQKALPIEREATSPVVEELRRAREAAEAKALADAKAAEERAIAKAKAAEEEALAAKKAAEEKAAAEAAELAKAKAAEEAAAQQSQDIIDWLARAVISGVKLSETESKVILNGDAYSVGEYVNFSLRLKVMIIQEKRVLFVDEVGKKYMKRL